MLLSSHCNLGSFLISSARVAATFAPFSRIPAWRSLLPATPPRFCLPERLWLPQRLELSWQEPEIRWLRHAPSSLICVSTTTRLLLTPVSHMWRWTLTPGTTTTWLVARVARSSIFKPTTRLVNCCRLLKLGAIVIDIVRFVCINVCAL